jgi:glycosyltransferase involved in cell wall biosynthesis
MEYEPPQELNLTAGDLFPDKDLSDAQAEIPPLPVDDLPEDALPALELPAHELQEEEILTAELDEVEVHTAPKANFVPQTGVGQQVATVLHARVVTGCGGGPEKTILRSPRFTDPTRYKMAAAYLYPRGDPGMYVIREGAKRFGCPLYEIAESHAIDHHAVDAMAVLCRDLKVDIWHSHDYKTNVLGRLIRRKHPMRLVTTAHGFTRETWRTRLYYHVDNLAMLGYDEVIAVSPPLIKHCAYHGVNPSRLTYIPNAIDTTEYTRTRTPAQAKSALGLPANHFAIGVIGRLSIEKGVDRAIRMLADITKTHPQVELHVIGDGPQRKELEALAGKLGVSNAIRWWGWQADARPIYEVLDTLLLPSRTEGLPNVVLEAMAMGVPVAATDVGGVSDLLDQGDCGVILGDDEHTWARQFVPLLTLPTLRESFADLAHRRVRDAFGFENRMKKVMEVYDRVLGRSATTNTTSVAPSDHIRLAA